MWRIHSDLLLFCAIKIPVKSELVLCNKVQWRSQFCHRLSCWFTLTKRIKTFGMTVITGVVTKSMSASRHWWVYFENLNELVILVKSHATFKKRIKVWKPLTHAGSVLCFGHASWAAVETLVSSLCVAALFVSWTHVSHALVDVCQSANITRVIFSSTIMTVSCSDCFSINKKIS